MLNFNWKFLVPLSLILVLTVAVVDKLIPAGADTFYRAGIHLVSNLLIGFVTLEVLRRVARVRRQAEGESSPPAGDAHHDEHASEAHPVPSAAH